MNHRVERVAGQLRAELSAAIREDLRDPRLRSMVTLTRARVSADLQHAVVAVSVLGGETERREALTALHAAAGLLRGRLGARLRLKRAPSLRFELDAGVEEGDRVLAAIDRVTGGADG
ncbi:MAG: 30S ribosome-binding factor RbfA [Dehalococcoidia bacterium]|nr:30S ribosome-binding factor RbfA [Dehalococcoidia bacterium]